MNGLLEKKIVLDSTSATEAEETGNVHGLHANRVLCTVPRTTPNAWAKRRTDNVIALHPHFPKRDLKRWERDAGL